MKKFNINNYVYLKLTDKGREIYYHRYDVLNERRGMEAIKPEYSEETNGLFKIQMWEVMALYGSHVCMGMNNLAFETTIYFDDRDIEDHE